MSCSYVLAIEDKNTPLPPVVMNTGGVCFHINIDFNYNHRAYRTTQDYHRTAAKTKTISFSSL